MNETRRPDAKLVYERRGGAILVLLVAFNDVQPPYVLGTITKEILGDPVLFNDYQTVIEKLIKHLFTSVSGHEPELMRVDPADMDKISNPDYFSMPAPGTKLN